jgi:hypothetical protein
MENTNSAQLSNWKNIINSAVPIDDVASLCFKLPLEIDKEKLVSSFYELISKLHPDYKEFCKQRYADTVDLLKRYHLDTEADIFSWWSINLNHMAHLTGDDRWGKYCGNFNMIVDQGADPRKFTTWLTELDNSYISDVIKKTIEYYETSTKKKFKGTASIIWVAPNSGYQFHKDLDKNILRCHIPLVTNSDVLWIFDHNKEYSKLNMQVGEVWELHPLDITHTVRNNSNIARAHLVLSIDDW